MIDLIEKLPPGARVLDLGARGGSFTTERADVAVVRLDLEMPAGNRGGFYMVADAARMPFAGGAFDLIISNHSLEHFTELEKTVREMGRVLRAGGGLYIAVPDATTLTDRIYRWLARGGGHVNAFRHPGDVIELVERLAGLEHHGTRVLYSSLSFLNARNFVTRPPRKIVLFACGHEGSLAVFTWTLRWMDRHFGTRLSHYGWSFYFGNIALPVGSEDWVNVCVRCGAGHSQAFLRKAGAVGRGVGSVETWRCPGCGGFNLLTRDG
jgi:SAM-dependent methyltransferase